MSMRKPVSVSVALVKAAVANWYQEVIADKVAEFTSRLLAGETDFLYEEEGLCAVVRNALLNGFVAIDEEIQELEEEELRLEKEVERNLQLKASFVFKKKEFSFASGDGRNWTDQIIVPVRKGTGAHSWLCHSAEFAKMVRIRTMLEAFNAYSTYGCGWMLTLPEWFRRMDIASAAHDLLKKHKWVFAAHHDYTWGGGDEFTIIYQDGDTYNFRDWE